MNETKRFLELDALRGIAAISVVFYHYASRFVKLYPQDFDSYFKFTYGNLGVELFFILMVLSFLCRSKGLIVQLNFYQKDLLDFFQHIGYA